MSEKTAVSFTLNGAEVAALTDLRANLLEVMRRAIGDFSPKWGCGQGTCGACTVLIDGTPRLACLTLALDAEGRRVDTAGGLADGPELHPLQRHFMEGFAAQCGYCTPGMLMSAKALLDKNKSPTRDEVIEAISGNLCRCTGYEPIVDAILAAAAEMRGRAA